MSTFSYDTRFAAELAPVFSVLTNPDFMEDYAKAIGATDWRVRADLGEQSAATEVVLALPTHRVPAVFRRLVGASVETTDERRWRAAGPAEFVADWTVHAVLGGRDSYLRGQLSLAATPEGSRLTGAARIDVHLGPLSRPASARISELVTAALDNQARVAERWLASS